MSLKRVEQLKAGKAFAKWDIVVYIALVVVVAALFVWLVFFPRGAGGTELSVSVDGEVVYKYDFRDGKETFDAACVEIDSKDGYIEVRVTCGGGYNIIRIDKERGEARVVDADCSVRKDCAASAAISTEKGGVIVCAPHKLKVEFVGADGGLTVG